MIVGIGLAVIVLSLLIATFYLWTGLFWFLLFLVLFSFLLLELIQNLASEHRLIFTFLALNQVVMIESGEGNPIKMIGHLPKGLEFDGFKIIPHPEGPNGIHERSWLEREYGLYYVGPPWRTVKLFNLIHTRRKKVITRDTPVTEWIERDELGEPEWFIQVNVLHEFVVPDVELEAGFNINVLVQLALTLTEPLVSLYERSGKNTVNFYGIIGEKVSTAVGNACRGIGRIEWQNKYKEILPTNTTRLTKGKPLDQEPMDELNQNLVQLSGYTAVMVMIPEWGFTTDGQKDLVRKKEEAEINKEIAELSARSQNAEFLEAMKAAKEQFPNAADELLINMITRVQGLRAVAKSPLTVYAEGGSNLSVSTPSQGGKGKKK